MRIHPADPFFLAKRALQREVSRMAATAEGTLVDVGCGTAPYRGLFSRVHYVGIETVRGSVYGSAKSGADVLYDGGSLPLRSGSVDNILCNQVLEHVFEPTDFLRELHTATATATLARTTHGPPLSMANDGTAP